jgi:RNA recognition motif-containing protein
MEDKLLYVGNLPVATSEDALRALFAHAGAVASVTPIKDHATGQSKGYAFIEMTTEADSHKAIRLYHGYDMDDQTLTVSLVQPRSSRGTYPRWIRSGLGHRTHAFTLRKAPGASEAH